ncbi:ATP-binding protein [Colwellia hornerae]|uniref:histidine kinase n=1 Tax=Colwellia hornerae TaxID=89402 RepID=A0A5C6Q638_9GAMM|nr:ATP-binding protein [Colwellia hornerae]TWX48834.1 GHKL domain-containing protein [Colwellia hornerae]TWX55334.1 GHKL domain-containing protein [Colwellia hornerae]TWX64405.1 GHKL domain-containing protein [Colwellia hornerae]
MNSLKIRLLLSTLVMTVVMLPIIGLTLSNAFERQLNVAMKNELKAYSYSIFTVAEVENNQLLMPDLLLENQFNINRSGLYALITKRSKETQISAVKSKVLWQSQSLLTLSLPAVLPSPDVGQTLISKISLADSRHLLYSFSASFSDNGQDFAITLHLIKDQRALLNALNDFEKTLWAWLLALMVVFVFVQIVWLLWTLKPLTVLSQELEHIEKGQKKALDANYPLELQPVTQQLNALLALEENQRKRYRNALSDLAHSLKNPLAVIQSQQDISASASEQLTLINNIIEHQLKRAQSAGQSSWHLGVQIKPVVDKLIATLAKIYHDKNLAFAVTVDTSALFKGDEADLMEILGNILDNACKAAKHKIAISVISSAKTLTIEIADDGAGIAASQREIILSRGGRADTYQAGHGIGLAIVNDLVSSYQGQLTISYSTVLTGAAFTLTF